MERQFFKKYLAQTSPEPMGLPITNAKDCYLTDNYGNTYIDLIGGISVAALGHGHPKVIKAIQDQAAKYLHVMVYGEAILSPQLNFAQQLLATLPASLDNVYFTNSGAEAVEGAMKLAKRYTGRTEIIACHQSYHGSTQGAMSLFGEEDYKIKFRPLLPDIKHIQHNSLPDLNQISTRTAAVIVEVIQAEAGCLVPDAAWLKQLRRVCTENEVLLVFDEIQSGMGRTGTMWAFQHFDVVPDILLSGKALGGGMPIGAFIAPKRIMDSLSIEPILGHMTTFGGHPVVCAAGLAALEVLLEENIISQVSAKEALFRKLLVHPKIESVSGKGLMLAVSLRTYDDVKKIIDFCCLQHNNEGSTGKGLFTDWFLFAPHCIRIVPPLTISNETIEEACDILLKALDQLNN